MPRYLDMPTQAELPHSVLHLVQASVDRFPRRSSVEFALWIGVIAISFAPCGSVFAADLLVADRLSNSVYRYSASGTLLGTVVDHSTDLNQPTGIGISPDFRKLYVSSSQNNRVLQYDYDAAAGIATNPTIFADAEDGLSFPSDIQFSPDGSKVYVANLTGGVSRFNTDGSSAGAKLLLPTTIEGVDTQTSSLAFKPTGELLAGAFQDPSGAGGGVAISNSTVSAFADYLVPPSAASNGAAGLMIHDDYLYVSGMFAFSIRRFALSNGQMDAGWGITGVAFPQDLVEAPDGNGFLAGLLGIAGGSGSISRYSFDGTLLGTFAAPSQNGFTEATAFVVVPTQLVGDFNNNGVVDAADYVVWRNTSPTTTLPNDDSPGVVDPSDYADWRANFGKVGRAGSGALHVRSIPEPAGVLIVLTAMLVAGLVRKRR